MTPETIKLIEQVHAAVPECRPDGVLWTRAPYGGEWFGHTGDLDFRGEEIYRHEHSPQRMLERTAWLAMVWLWRNRSLTLVSDRVNVVVGRNEPFKVQGGHNFNAMLGASVHPSEAVLRAALAVAERQVKP